MRIPIQYALSYPVRVDLNTKRLNFSEIRELTFFTPDTEKFPCLAIAYNALERGGNATCIMNAANEVAVQAFLEDKIRFADIPDIISETMSRSTFIKKPSIEDIYSTNFEANTIAVNILKTQY